MPRDFADRALMKRGKGGALKSRLPATGSSLAGGSILHKRGRKQLMRAMRQGLPILCRAEDNVAIRKASYDEVIRAYHSPNGRIFVGDVQDTDERSYGTECVIRRWKPEEFTESKFDPKPRLVKKEKK